MKKELKQILLICLFLIIGCVLGYFVALNQMNQLNIIFYSLPEQHSQPDVEVILEKMEDVRSLQETKEDYNEWKKQNQNNAND